MWLIYEMVRVVLKLLFYIGENVEEDIQIEDKRIGEKYKYL